MQTKCTQVAQRRQDDVEKGSPHIGRTDSKHGQDQDQTKHPTDSVGAVWDEAFLVVFGSGDAENPLNWSQKLKWGVTAAVSGTGFIRITVSTVSLPPELKP